MSVSPTAIARTLGITTTYQSLANGTARLLPQRVAVIAQGASAATYSTTKFLATSAAQVGSALGFGSPAHLTVDALLPRNGDGLQGIPVTVYPLEDHGSGTEAAGDITPSGTAVAAAGYRVKAGNVLSEEFTIAAGAITVGTVVAAIVAAINANPSMPIIASDGTTKVDVVSKWAGASANGIKLELVGGEGNGVSFAITQPTGGTANPDVQTAIDQIGSSWETMIINAMEHTDTTTLDAFSVFNEGRWDVLEHKPCAVLTGNTVASRATASAISSARPLDRTNAFIANPGSNELPFVVAARAVARIAQLANENPPTDYGGLILSGVSAGADGDQWNSADRDAAVKAGCSTVEVENGAVVLSDTVTFYHPSSEDPPAYRYLVDIVKLQNVNYNVDVEFKKPEWRGAPLLPAGQFTTNRRAKTPSMAIGKMAQIIDALAEAAIISDPGFSKANTTATINAQNPKRLDISTIVKLSGNTNIVDVSLNWGFYFGGVAA